MKLFITSLLCLLVSESVFSETLEKWACREPYASGDPLVVATVEEGRKTGSIFVSGVTKKSQFSVDGFDRRWNFDLREDGYFSYSFVIRPNGDGLYYSFLSKEKVGPTYIMKCKEIER